MSTVSLMIESLVAVLLLVTIGYSVVLNGRLKRLKADEQALKATISELITATEIAGRAIAGLKATAREADRTLGERLRRRNASPPISTARSGAARPCWACSPATVAAGRHQSSAGGGDRAGLPIEGGGRPRPRPSPTGRAAPGNAWAVWLHDPPAA